MQVSSRRLHAWLHCSVFHTLMLPLTCTLLYLCHTAGFLKQEPLTASNSILLDVYTDSALCTEVMPVVKPTDLSSVMNGNAMMRRSMTQLDVYAAADVSIQLLGW